MSSKLVRKKRKGGMAALMKRVRTPGTVASGIIDAGMHEGEDESADVTVAFVGFVNEFGTDDGRVPERSFIRSTIQEKKKQIIALQRKLLRKIVLGEMTTEHALGLLGEFVSDKISLKIVSLKTPPNAPATLVGKFPKTNPLIDSSQLKNSITYEVNR